MSEAIETRQRPEYFAGQVLWVSIDGLIMGSCGPIWNILPSEMGAEPPVDLPFAVKRDELLMDCMVEECIFSTGSQNNAYVAYPFTSESLRFKLPVQAELTWEPNKKGDGSLISFIKIDGCSGLAIAVPWPGYRPLNGVTEIAFLKWFMSSTGSLMARAFAPEVWYDPR